MKQKHFMDIARIKEDSNELSLANTTGFEVGDFIVIQEKVDGANASIRFNKETGTLEAFSRKHKLSMDKNLNGFWDYVQTLKVAYYSEYESYVIFGEWLLKNTIKYEQEAYNKWYVFDIYDTEEEKYLLQKDVKDFCDKMNLIYVKTFYKGPFVSWDHCRSFVGKSDIALDLGEGVVIKNQTKQNNEVTRLPFVLKIVGEHFKEVQKSNAKQKWKDPNKLQEKAMAKDIAEQIITYRRVEKELFKMRDEDLLPNMIEAEHMAIIAKNLPKRIYNDCVKEEPEMVANAGKYFGKVCGNTAMKFAKDIILGGKNE